MTRARRLRSDFTLGGGAAEADPLLKEAFYESGDYSAIKSRRDPRTFIVARTGAGKSAALAQLEEEFPKKVIRISPQDLSLPYITDMQVMKYLSQLDVRLDLFFEALWKHVFLVEIIRHRYNIDSDVVQQNFFRNLLDRISRDPAKREALNYLKEFEGKFWCETDQRVREIVQKFEQSVERDASAKLAVGGQGGSVGGKGRSGEASETRIEEADRYQRIVNNTQLARLNKMISVLNDDILESSQNAVYVIIDDLDTQWVDERLSNDLIRCLFSTVQSLKRVKNLKVLVALRTNIFESIDFGEHGAQGEKFRSLILQMRWSRGDLRDMLDERARAAGREKGFLIGSIGDVVPISNARRDAIDYILDRTLLRPRDAISFLNICFSSTSGNGNRLTWEDIGGAERAYSTDRLDALRDEWNPSFPDIMRAFSVFNNAESPMARLVFEEYLDEIMLLIVQHDFRGGEWLSEMSAAMWNSGTGGVEWIKIYKPLTVLLFNIGFIGCRERSGRFVYSHEDADYIDHHADLGPGAQFSIHPAFHCALNIRIRDDERQRLNAHGH